MASCINKHGGEVCGLKWSTEGNRLASGGNENLLYIWEASQMSSSKFLHRLRDHGAAVKALAWCPYHHNVLASGGGLSDGCIKLWNTQKGICINSIETKAQVNLFKYFISHSLTCTTLYTKHHHFYIVHLISCKRQDLWAGVEQTSQGVIEWPWLQHKGESKPTVPLEIPFHDQGGGVGKSEVQNYQPMPGLTVQTLNTELSWILAKIYEKSEVSCTCVLQSPDGLTVISAAADETLRFWDVFGPPSTGNSVVSNLQSLLSLRTSLIR